MKESRTISLIQAGEAQRGLRLALLLLFLIASLRIAWLCDDAFISFRTVDNFVHGHGLTWNTDERVQAYTHPLWLFLVSAAYRLTLEMTVTPMLLCLACAGAAVAIVLFRLGLDLGRGALFVALLLASQALLDYSSSGLENALSYLLLAWFVGEWPHEGPARLARLFLIGGLLALNRLDLALLVAPALAVAWWPQRSRAALGAALLGLSPLFAWELFSLVYYGFPFPNTYYAKLNTGIPKWDYLMQGLSYGEDLLVQDPATALILALGIVAAWRGARPLALGLLAYCGYIVWVGGDFMQGRLYSVPAFLALMLLVRDPRSLAGPVPLPALAGIALGGVLANTLVLTRYAEKLPDAAVVFRGNGVADERRFYLGYGEGLSRLIRGRTLLNEHPWAQDALRWRGHGGVYVAGTVGVTGFVAGPGVHIVDIFALTEPLLARLPVTGPWRIGHFERRLPEGLVDTLVSGRNQIADPAIARLHEQLDLVTRGPIWSAERLRAIVALNLGGRRNWDPDQIGIAVASAAQLALPKPAHYPWNGGGTLVIDKRGAEVRFPELHHEPRLSISADNNDRYRLRLLAGAEPRGELLVEPSFDGPGLMVQVLDLPALATTAGYDRIRVLPSEGDGWYSLGHLIPQGPAP